MSIQLTPDERLRFFSKIGVGRSEECWLWPTQGYGVFTVARDGRRINIGAHRLAWELANAQPIPDGLHVCHRCDIKRCVNPAHLFIGTPGDNIRDCVAKGRHNSQQPDGLKVSGSDVAVIVARAAAGDQYIDIGRDLGLSRTTVSYYARGKMKRTTQIEPQAKRLGHKWSARIDKDAVMRLRQDGLSFNHIGRRLGIGTMSAWRIVRHLEGARGFSSPRKVG